MRVKLFESWLSEKKESETKVASKDVSTVRDMLSLPYSKFVNILKNNSRDPKVQAVLNMGKDDGIPGDEKIKVNPEASFKVRELEPTQSQIGFDNSIGYLAGEDPKSAEKIIKGDTSSFDNNRILTANGKYILDGHHRWSQVYALNPNAMIPAVDLYLPGLEKEDILRVIQAAISSTYKDVHKQPADAATDLFDEKKMPTHQMEERIKAIIDRSKKGEEFMEVIKRAYGLDELKAIKKLSDNAIEIKKKKPKSAPAREYMPQPSTTAKNAGRPDKETKDFKGMPGDFIDKLKSGELNFKDPF